MAAPLNPKIQDLVARLNRDPDSRIFLQLADEYRKAGHLEEALLVCKAGLKKHPGYHSARVALGRIFLALNRLEEAHTEFEAVVRTAPDNLLANRMLGDVLALAGDVAGARERYRAVLALGPAEPELKSKIEALERGEDPRQVGRWGNDLPAPQPGPTAGAARATAAQPPPRAPAPPAPPAAPPPATQPSAPPSSDRQTFRRVLPTEPTPAAPAPPLALRVQAAPAQPPAPPSAAPQARPAHAPPISVQMPASTRIERDSMSTHTLAELYVRQGFTDRAAGVYRRILSVEPGNAEARRRLEELTAAGAPRQAAAGPAAAAMPPESAKPMAEGRRPPAERAAAIERLARWLKTIQAGAR